MIKKIISILLCVTFTLTMFSVSVSAEETEEYDVFLLPVISEKMLADQRYDQIQVYWDKNSNIPFVSIDQATSIVGGSCNYKTGWYTVDKDYFHFRYNNQDDMKLYLGDSDYGILLLDGNLFESRLIHGRWYVDFLGFCYMFDEKFEKIDSNISAKDGFNTDDIAKYKLFMEKNYFPFFLYISDGYNLSSAYEDIMQYKGNYVWNYSKYPESETWFKNIMGSSEANIKTFSYNYLSNVVCDWGNTVSAAVVPYKPDEHYTEALINITNINYLKYLVEYNKYDNNYYSLTKGDSLYTALNSYNVAEDFINNKIPEDLQKALKGFTIFLDTYQTVAQTIRMYKYLDSIDSRRIQLLQDSIINNTNLSSMAENDQKTRKWIEKLSVYSTGATSVSHEKFKEFIDDFNLPFNPAKYHIRNPYLTILNYSLNNSASLKDSAEKLTDSYRNQTKQVFDTLENGYESIVSSVGNEVLINILESSPKTKPVALVIGLIDKLMSASKVEFGETLKKSELLYQCEYIEQVLLQGLDERDKHNLRSRLSMLLRASLFCHLLVPDSSTKDIKDICSLLYDIDYDSDNLRYYNDPRNLQPFNDIKELIVDYKTERVNKGTISGKVLTEDKNLIEKAKISVFVFANGIGIGSEEDVYYTDSEGKFSIPVSAKNEYMLQVTCDGYKSADDNEFVKIYPVAVERQEDTYVGDIYMKVPDNTSDNSWRNIYKQFLYNKLDSDKGYGAFDLFDLNDDGIPELFVSDGFGAHVNSCFMYSINDNEISQDICSGQYGELYLDKDIKIVIGVGHTNGRGDKWKIYCKVDSNKNFVVDHFREIPVQYKESFFVNGTEVTKEVYQNKLQEYKRLNTKEIGRTNKLTKENIDYIIDHWGKDNTISEENINGFWREVIVSNTTTAAISQDDELYMWGSNYYGQIGNGTTTEQLTPYKVLSDVKSISLSSTNSAAITNSGELYIWGSNYDGDIGNGIYGAYSSQKNQLIPYKVLSNVKSVSLGLACSAAITNSGELYMWGGNFDGQIGNGTTKNQLTPYKVLNNIKSISLGRNRSAAITDNGDLYMWGSNYYGQIGNGTTKDQLTPYKVLSNVKNIMLEDNDIAAITNDDDLYLWGYNSYGQVGNGTTKDQLTPYKVLGNVRNVSLGYANIATITNNGDLYIWGDNFHGQIGNGTTKDQLTPCKVLSNVKSVSLGHFYNVSAITNNSDLYIWGGNSDGQIGNGTTEDQLTPCKVLSNVKNIMLENYHGAAITNNDDLYMWGENIYGQIGNGTTDSQLTPYKVLSNVKGVLLNSFDSVGITNNDELYTWGFNGYGKIGNGTTDNQFVPYKVTVE